MYTRTAGGEATMLKVLREIGQRLAARWRGQGEARESSSGALPRPKSD